MTSSIEKTKKNLTDEQIERIKKGLRWDGVSNLVSGLIIIGFILLLGRIEVQQANPDALKVMSLVLVFALFQGTIIGIYNRIAWAYFQLDSSDDKRDDVMLANSLTRRDSSQRNAILFSAISVLVAVNPQIVTDLPYFKELGSTEFRPLAFISLILISVFFVLRTENAIYDVARYSGTSQTLRFKYFLPPEGGFSIKQVLKFEHRKEMKKQYPFSILNFSADSVPKTVMVIGISACFTRLIADLYFS